MKITTVQRWCMLNKEVRAWHGWGESGRPGHALHLQSKAWKKKTTLFLRIHTSASIWIYKFFSHKIINVNQRNSLHIRVAGCRVNRDRLSEPESFSELLIIASYPIWQIGWEHPLSIWSQQSCITIWERNRDYVGVSPSAVWKHLHRHIFYTAFPTVMNSSRPSASWWQEATW